MYEKYIYVVTILVTVETSNGYLFTKGYVAFSQAIPSAIQKCHYITCTLSTEALANSKTNGWVFPRIYI